ncbi:hypothetical protein [Arachidicoccus ginsenosidivorans]|uniref:hypothetical protein n=1 Tax=Arachidicoccus ginsenosidivorans TaxID=496057 RepID=UPI001315A933|nr:hypothetical protein [Arachidicoccus ginsenosidivorans]
MDSNILNYAKDLLSGNFTDAVAGKLGESPESVKKPFLRLFRPFLVVSHIK